MTPLQEDKKITFLSPEILDTAGEGWGNDDDLLMDVESQEEEDVIVNKKLYN